MRMLTYVIRRLALVVPVVIGVMTIVFVLVSALPVYNQLVAAFGNPNPHDPCGYQPTCPCSDIYPGEKGTCSNPVYVRLTHELGLDRPVFERYFLYIYHAFTFQWGTVANQSAVEAEYPFAKNVPVTKFLGEMLPSTIELATLSLIIILAIAIPLGNLGAVNRNRPIDQASRVISFSGYAIPPFLLGSFVLIGVFYLLYPHTGLDVHTPWCPSGEVLYAFNGPSELSGSWPAPGCYSGTVSIATNCPLWLASCLVSHPTGFPTYDAVYHGQYWIAVDSLIRMILPALVVAYGSIAILLRFVRNSMLEVMNLDYIRTARAKGVPEAKVISKHAGRNSLNVTVTVLGLTFAGFLGGFPIIEEVFYLNGVGRALVLAAQPGGYDFAVIYGSTILFTYLIVSANLIVDVLYAYLDPRVRLG